MKRFQFPLEQALKWRTTRLDMEQAKLAHMQQEKDRARQLGTSLRAAAQREVVNFRQGSRNVTGMELALLASYRQGVANRLKTLESLISSCDSRIDIQKAAVMEADREMRLLESLKQRQLEKWSYEMNREIESTASELFLANRRRLPNR